MCEFYIAFALEPVLTVTHKGHNINELALFDPNTKWKQNELPTTNFNLNHVATVIDTVNKTVKLFPFQDFLDIEFEDVLDSDT